MLGLYIHLRTAVGLCSFKRIAVGIVPCAQWLRIHSGCTITMARILQRGLAGSDMFSSEVTYRSFSQQCLRVLGKLLMFPGDQHVFPCFCAEGIGWRGTGDRVAFGKEQGERVKDVFRSQVAGFAIPRGLHKSESCSAHLCF